MAASKLTGIRAIKRLTPELSRVVGQPRMARTEVTKQLWVYIKQNNLQNPANKREIVNDQLMKGVFGVERMSMFEMPKLLTKHLLPDEE